MWFFEWLQARRWNPVNVIDLSTRYRNAPPDVQVRYAQSPPQALRFQGDWRRVQYYRQLDEQLSKVDPDVVGIEALVDARMAAARGNAIGGLAAEMREVRRLVSELNMIASPRSPADGWNTRKRARKHAAVRLAWLAEFAAREGDFQAAIEALCALRDTGEISPSQLRTLATLLRAHGKSSEHQSLRTYLQCLEAYKRRCQGDRLLEELREVLVEQLHIDEQTSRHEAEQRLPLIARAMAGGDSSFEWPLSLGAGYLVVNQPGRAIPHLERACSLDGRKGGETQFLLGRSLSGAGQFERAAAAFEEAASRGYPASRIAAWRGSALIKGGERAAAEKIFEEAEQNQNTNRSTPPDPSAPSSGS